jgi:hypothetical protein
MAASLLFVAPIGLVSSLLFRLSFVHSGRARLARRPVPSQGLKSIPPAFILSSDQISRRSASETHFPVPFSAITWS